MGLQGGTVYKAKERKMSRGKNYAREWVKNRERKENLLIETVLKNKTA